MHLVASPISKPLDLAETEQDFAGMALVVLFADGAEIDRVRDAGGGALALRPPFHMGEDDAYLVLPEDIGEEIVDILRDGDLELLSEALRDGLIVLGEVTKNPRAPGMALLTHQVCRPSELLARPGQYANVLPLRGSDDPVRALNQLPHLQCTTLSAFVDEDGLEAILQAEDYVGVSWRPPASARALSDIDPTHVWTRRLESGDVGVELVLFREDEELVAVLRPACLRLA